MTIVNRVSEPHKIMIMPRVGGGQYKKIFCKCKNFKVTMNKNGRFKQCYNISLIKLAKALKTTGSIMLRFHTVGKSINFYNLIDYRKWYNMEFGVLTMFKHSHPTSTNAW